MESSSNKPTAFVMMPFDPEFKEVYELFTADALNKAGYEVFRADDLQTQRSILQDIVSSIVSCDLIVADLTGINPNVFYELGLAHGLKRPVILLTQCLDDIPFDLRPYRVLPYEIHFARIDKAKEKLIELAKGALLGTVPFGSPVTDFEGSKVGLPSKVTQSEKIGAVDSKELKKELDERGFLDHLVDFQDGYSNLTEIIKEINSATRVSTTKTEEVTSKINDALKKPSSGTPSYLRKLLREFGDEYSKYAETIMEKNEKYYTIARNTDNSLEFIISYQKPTTESDRQKLRKILDKLTEFEDAATYAKKSLQNLATTIENIPKMERHFDRARSIVSTAINKFVENIDRTIASIKRALEIGRKKLEHPDIDDNENGVKV